MNLCTFHEFGTSFELFEVWNNKKLLFQWCYDAWRSPNPLCTIQSRWKNIFRTLHTHTGVVFIYKCTSIYIYITECWNQDQLQELSIILTLEKFFYQPVSFRQGFSARLLNNCLPPNLYLLIAFVINSYNSVVKLDNSIWKKFNSDSSNTNAIYMIFYILVCRLGFLKHSQTMSINIRNWVYQ